VAAAPTRTTRLPIRPVPADDEALDSYLERLAEANHLSRPQLRSMVPTGASPSHVTTAPAHRGWELGRSSQLCAACFAREGIWRTAWRQPWITVCLDHEAWLHDRCPTCARPFRSQRHSPLRSVDAIPGTCGNPAGSRGRACPQDLDILPSRPAPPEVLAAQRRIHHALAQQQVAVLGESVEGAAYLAELKALTILVLHLACQPGGSRLAEWVAAARGDRARSPGSRVARWGLAPPASPVLRGHALTAADQVLAATTLDAAAERLAAWLELTPHTPDGRLGWLADHTTMTLLLTRMVMTATSTRCRISTQLRHGDPLPGRVVPQVLPDGLYARHLGDKLDVSDSTGRLFASLCLTRLGRPDLTWDTAADQLGLPANLGYKTARACSSELLCTTGQFAGAIQALADHLTGTAGPVDYRHREQQVRRLAGRARWYRAWAREHHPGSHSASRRYAVTWLWSEYAGGHLSTSPGWATPPSASQRWCYRAYCRRLAPAARTALLRVATDHQERRPR
jgi:hypothetical protein